MDYLLDMAIAIILSTLKTAIKNPGKAETLKKAMLKIRTQIDLVYGSQES